MVGWWICRLRPRSSGKRCKVSRRPGALPLDPAGAVGPRPHFICSEIGIGCATAGQIHSAASRGLPPRSANAGGGTPSGVQGAEPPAFFAPWVPELFSLPYIGPMSDDYLARLNPEQRAAVEAIDGPLLVLAGAGTGKTRVLTTRFAHILLTGRAFPSQVLAVTFTNKAAREMRERVAGIMGGPAEGLWLGTFHALCARMLRRHAELVGLDARFNII